MLLPLHGMQTIDYLKIDIEGGEWEVMQQVIESGMLSQVRQMSVEFHLFLHFSHVRVATIFNMSRFVAFVNIENNILG